jgi:hypothetical protein
MVFSLHDVNAQIKNLALSCDILGQKPDLIRALCERHPRTNFYLKLKEVPVLPGSFWQRLIYLFTGKLGTIQTTIITIVGEAQERDVSKSVRDISPDLDFGLIHCQ